MGEWCRCKQSLGKLTMCNIALAFASFDAVFLRTLHRFGLVTATTSVWQPPLLLHSPLVVVNHQQYIVSALQTMQTLRTLRTLSAISNRALSNRALRSRTLSSNILSSNILSSNILSSCSTLRSSMRFAFIHHHPFLLRVLFGSIIHEK